MKHIALLIVVGLSTITSVIATPTFYMDHAVFKAGEYSLLQVYVMIDRSSIEHIQKDSIYVAQYDFLVEIRRADSTLTSIVYNRIDKVVDLSEITTTQKIPDEASFHIVPGTFTVSVVITDMSNDASRVREKEVIIKGFPEDKLALSDIQLASRIEKVRESGRFVKNRVLVIPHADGMFGGELLAGYYYMEIYNLCLEDPQAEYTIRRTILDENKSLIKELPIKKVLQNASSVLEADLFSCATLGTGAYYLRIEVMDGCTGDTAMAEKKFWIYKKGDEIEPQAPVVIGKMEEAIRNQSQEECIKETEYLRYLTSRSENRVIDNLDPENASNFLINFWRNRDPSGEMRKRYITRVEVANERYSSIFTEGWKTDRGRVLIIYGEPDMIERRNFQLGGPDNEIWYYDRIEGGIIFLFSDLKGTGDMKQVYSNKIGEYIDAGWLKEMEMLNPGFMQDLRTQ